jgi:hypothetical protein
MVAQAITTARAAGVSGLITVRGDSAYGCRAVVGTCRRYGAVFSLVLTRNSAVHRAIDAISKLRTPGHPFNIPVRCAIPLPGPGSLMPRSNPAPGQSPPA